VASRYWLVQSGSSTRQIFLSFCLGCLCLATGCGLFGTQTNKLTVQSTNPQSGVQIRVIHNDDTPPTEFSHATPFTDSVGIQHTNITVIAPLSEPGGHLFVGWSNCDPGPNPGECKLDLTSDKTVTANYLAPAAPAFTSADNTIFTVNISNSVFVVTATGVPVPTITETGTLPPGITFGPQTDPLLPSGIGLLGKPAGGSGGKYNITFTASNSLGTAVQAFTLTVNEPPTITSASSTNVTEGVFFSFQVTARGFPTPSLSLPSVVNNLPLGVTFDSATGVLSGTPAPGTSTASPYHLDFDAFNGVFPDARQTFTLFVGQASTSLAVQSLTFNPNPVVGGQNTTGTVTLTGPAPAGGVQVSFLNSNAVLVGIPPVTIPAGASSATFTATTGAVSVSTPATITASVLGGTGVPATLTLNPAAGGALAISPATLPPATINVPYVVTLTATGGTPPYTWSVGQSPSQTLPQSVTLAPATGVLSGTPLTAEAGNYKIFATVKDSTNQTATQPYLFVVSNGSPCALNGQYAFLFQGFDAGGTVATAGSFTVASGAVTGGAEDINRSTGVSANVPLSGTQADCVMAGSNIGVLTLTTPTQPPTTTYIFTTDSLGTEGKFIEFDRTSAAVGTSGSGLFLKQTALSLGPGGNVVFGLSGEFRANIGQPGVPTPVRAVAAGQLTLDGTANITSGEMDVSTIKSSVFGTAVTSGPLLLTAPAGTFAGIPDTNGRNSATLLVPSLNNTTGIAGTLNFVYYVAGPGRAILLQTDARSSTVPVLGGVMRPQGPIDAGFGAPGAGASLVFATNGLSNFSGPTVSIGQILPDGAGALTGTIDQTASASGTAVTGTYTTVDAKGRVKLTLGTQNQVVYLLSDPSAGAAEGIIVDAPGAAVGFGELKQQASPIGGFNTGSLNGLFRANSVPPSPPGVPVDAGQATLDGIGPNPTSFNFGFNEDVANINPLAKTAIGGNYAVAANGRGTVTVPPSATPALVFWTISPHEFVLLKPLGAAGTLLEFRQ
jgi:hypothetical protein